MMEQLWNKEGETVMVEQQWCYSSDGTVMVEQ